MRHNVISFGEKSLEGRDEPEEDVPDGRVLKLIRGHSESLESGRRAAGGGDFKRTGK